MNTATTNRTTTRRQPRTAASQRHVRPTADVRRTAPMPRSTTRVIWTMSSGATVQYGEVR
jgi:hypothetical protein